MPVVRSSEGRSATVTQSLRPSKLRARPKCPRTRFGPASMPVFSRPEASAVLAPDRSSKPQAPTSFAGGGRTGGGLPRIDRGTVGSGAGVAVDVGVGVGVGVGVRVGV